VTNRLDLGIADVQFEVEIPEGVQLAVSQSEYGPFLGETSPSPARIAVGARLVLGGAPETAALPVLFDTQGGWRAFGCGADVLLELRLPDAEDEPLWLTRLSPGVHEVTIHCGSRLLEEARGCVTLHNPLSYPLDELLMMHILPVHRGLVLHAAGFRQGAIGVAFPGRSGSGKSTLMRLVGRRTGVEGLSDDRVIVREVGGSFLVYGTPWAGTEGVATSASARLGAMAFLHQASDNRLRRLDPKAALQQLLPTASILWYDQDRMTQSLQLCGELARRIPAYELHFTQEAAVYDLLVKLF